MLNYHPICRYRGYRDVHGDHTPFFWRLLAIRLSFVIVFEVRPLLLRSVPLSDSRRVSKALLPFQGTATNLFAPPPSTWSSASVA